MAILKYDSQMDEQAARGGSFDLTGTDALVNKQFWGFHASDDAVISAIKGIPINTSVANLAAIRAAEVDVSGILVTNLALVLFANVLYRVDGYIITSVTLSAGSLHLYKTKDQVSA